MLNIILNKTVSIKLYVLIITILLTGTLIFLSISYFSKSLSHLSSKYSELELMYETCEKSEITLNKTISDYKRALINLRIPEGVKDYNKKNPIGAIKDELRNHKEVIPYEGVLGGTMGFYIPGNILILNDRWIYAEFEDGHIGGAILLKYEISKDSVLTWDVIDAFCPFFDRPGG